MHKRRILLISLIALSAGATAWSRFRPFRQPTTPEMKSESTRLPVERPESAQSQPPAEPAKQEGRDAPSQTATLFRNPFDELVVESAGEQITGWTRADVDGKNCLISPVNSVPCGDMS